MTKSHILGFPRIGAHRELKKAVESYWRGEISQAALETVGKEIRQTNWQMQHDAGLDFVTVGDFSWYDQVLDMSAMLGVVPERFHQQAATVDLNTYFCMARGQAPNTNETTACEMTKWFNTNYHYIVPEFSPNQTFKLSTEKLFHEIAEAQQKNYQAKPVLLGPLTYLWLGKTKTSDFDKLALLDKLIPVYNQILAKLNEQKITWLQIDEPILVLDLNPAWRQALQTAYQKLNFGNVKCLLATYFGALKDNLAVANQLPVHGLHLDLCSAPEQLADALATVSNDKILSLGLINGRNIWRTNIQQASEKALHAKQAFGNNIWLASSCSLLHSPVDLNNETKLDQELKSWLAFGKQKITEVALLAKIVAEGAAAHQQALQENQAAIASRANSARVHNAAVAKRVKSVDASFAERQSPYAERAVAQKAALQLPLFPTTTIGSFPQTKEIRTARQDFKAGRLSAAAYQQKMQAEIAQVISQQEALDLDVLVHGEAERNDMVEYFGELLQGFAFTSNGWVQSYGSRCVKPPVIFGDVYRPNPMTVEWITYAQSLSNKLVKGMLTGPVTILAWSFVRDDQPHAETAMQIALALRDEVTDLEQAGIKVIQIDEPAFRESLPLRRADWQKYLDWAVNSFRVSASGVQDSTQIHTHMCYSEFNDVIKSIADLDADVITIESSRSEMELLKAFETFAYPNEIGPGVYDIHSPRVPSDQEIIDNMERAINHIPAARLWVNPDCGLKTRGWEEVNAALKSMVLAAKYLRDKYNHEAPMVGSPKSSAAQSALI